MTQQWSQSDASESLVVTLQFKPYFFLVPGVFNEFTLKVVFLAQALACPCVRLGCEYLLLMD